MTLEASDDMLEYYRELQRQGRLSRTSHEYAYAQGYCDETLAKLTEDVIQDAVKRSRIRLEIQGSPLKYRPTPKPANPNDPTEQWQRKANGHVGTESLGRGEVVPAKKYRVKNVIEQHGDKLAMSMRTALERFFQDASYSQRSRVIDLNRTGGAEQGDRIGGLGNAPQFVRDGHARHEWLQKQLAPELKSTAAALVSRELLKPDGAPFSLEDFGARMFPAVQDKNRRWGAAAGAIWSLAAQLVHLYPKCPIKVRAITNEERQSEQRQVTTGHIWHSNVE